MQDLSGDAGARVREESPARDAIRARQWAGRNSVFADALDKFRDWERMHIPFAGTGAGQEVLLWLAKPRRHPALLKDLYRSSRFSEPTIRHCIQAYSQLGLVVVTPGNDHDLRQRFAFATPKLKSLLIEYQSHFFAVTAHCGSQASACNSVDPVFSASLTPLDDRTAAA